MLLRREQSFLSKLSCPRIVKYLGSVVSNENNVPTYNLCMEYVPGGSLFDAIRRNGGCLEESRITSYTCQILQGLEYLHLHGLAHCDIKSQNILLGEDGVKIADLGCAKLVGVAGSEDSASKSTLSGTPLFMAPEVARGEEQGFAADTWALGCTVIEMATGRSPWPEASDPVAALFRIGYSSDVPEFPSWLSDKAKDFLRKCLRRNPKERWMAKELLGHPFVKSLGSNPVQVIKESTLSSPISVLDQEMWDSLEVLGCPQDLTSEGLSLNCPAERIKQLNGGTFPSNVANWTWDENWFTARCSDSQNLSEINNVESISDLTSSAIDSVIHEEELEEGSPSQEELPYDYFSEIVSTVGTDRHSVILCNDMEFSFESKSCKIEVYSKDFCSTPISLLFTF